jgi:hypothetical protein
VECMLQFVSIHREVHSMVSPSWGVVFRWNATFDIGLNSWGSWGFSGQGQSPVSAFISMKTHERVSNSALNHCKQTQNAQPWGHWLYSDELSTWSVDADANGGKCNLGRSH